MRRTILICLTLVMVTFAVYWQVGNHEFLNYDDDLYIVRNVHVSKGITGANIIWAFTSVEQCNWHPLTWLSHMLDVQLYGMNPRGHHLTNVAFHSIAAVLLLLLLLRLTDRFWQSSFVAAMFALHPLHVESVAWAAERKDVLSGCFWVLTLLLYSRYAEKRRNGTGSCTPIYLLTLLSFILGLMSKPMLVTLPVIMLLLDYWPLQRFATARNRGDIYAIVMDKAPFFVCSVLSAALTIYAQRKGGAVVALEWISFTERLQNATVSYLEYIIKTVWPHKLAVLYPFSLPIPLWQVIFSCTALCIISAASIWWGKRYPFLPVGWFWFLITLLPVIGILQVGNQSMADRYSYIPAIGLFVMAAWGVPALFEMGLGLHRTAECDAVVRGNYRMYILPLLASLAIVAAVAVTWRQIGHWKNNFSLYRHALDVTTGNYIIRYNLGLAYGRSGNTDASIKEFQAAVMIKPYDCRARNMLASTLAEKGDIDAAIAEFTKSLSVNPNDKDAKYSLEFWQGQKGKNGTARK